jgi:putative ABC transport system substrate-binding protein
VTGFSALVGELSGKQLGLLHEVVPKATTIAALFGGGVFLALRDARDAAAALGLKLLVLEARTPDEIDAQFASLDREPADAMFVIVSPFFGTGRGRLRRSRHAIESLQSM